MEEKNEEEEEEKDEEEEEKDEEEEKVQGTRRKLLSMALILPGYMRFELRLITQLVLVCTGEFIDVLMFITNIFSITETHSPMQIKHIKRK